MKPSTTEASEPLGTVHDVAALAKVSTSWAYKASERGELPCIRVGALLRFDMAAVRRFFADHASHASKRGATP